MKLQNPRGMKDLSPEESIFRNQIINLIKQSFENYGFSPLETPIVERFDILSAKIQWKNAPLNLILFPFRSHPL